MNIRGFRESSITEWEDKLSSVVWVGGCNWRCPFCHASSLLNDALPVIDEEFVIKQICDRREWLDGVCITGGEPTLQNDLEAFIDRVELPVKLETNGSRPAVIEKLIHDRKIQCLSLDFKTSVSRLSELGGDAVEWSTSLGVALGAAIDVEFHTTLCPAFVDVGIIQEIGSYLHNKGAWFLQQYNPKDVLDITNAGRQTYNAEEIENIINAATAVHDNVIVKGIR